MGALQNFQKSRVRVYNCYRTHRSFGYCGRGVPNSQKIPAGIKMSYPYPGCCVHGRTELTEVPGTGISVIQNLPNVFVGQYPGEYPGYGSVRTVHTE